MRKILLFILPLMYSSLYTQSVSTIATKQNVSDSLIANHWSYLLPSDTSGNYIKYYQTPWDSIRTKVLISDSTIGKINFGDLNWLYNSQYRNINARFNDSKYNAFGIMVRCANGELLDIYRYGSAHISTDGKIVMNRSIDGGRTWSDTVGVYDSYWDDRNVGGGVTPTGRIVIFLTRAVFGQAADIVASFGYMYSNDNDYTWSNFSVIPKPISSAPYPDVFGKLNVIAGGKLMMSYGMEEAADNHYELHVIFSTDNGATWGNDIVVYNGMTPVCECNYQYLGSGNIVGISRCESKPMVFCQFKSTDNGNTWTNMGITNFETQKPVCPWLTLVDFGDREYVACIYADRGNNGLFYRLADVDDVLNSATCWTDSVRILTNSQPNPLVTAIIGYPSIINPLNSPNIIGVYDDAVNDLNVVQRYFTYTISSPTYPATGIDSQKNMIPLENSLSQNYPNPFNPSTMINFQLPVAEKVTLIICNALGQKIKTLVNDFREAGRYHLMWDGKNDFDHSVASGIYFYRIQAGNFIDMKKMILLK